MKKIEVLPVNGFGNRIQTIASAIHSAKKLNIPLRINWLVDDKFPLSSSEIFAKQTLDKFNFVDIRTNLYEKYKIGWTNLSENQKILLKGGKKGEQYFIRSYLQKQIDYEHEDIVVVAGGFFDLTSFDFNPSDIRNNFSEIEFNDELVRECQLIQNRIPEKYSILHLRFSDKSHESARVNEVLDYFIKKPESLPICILSDDIKIKTEVVEKLKMSFPKTFTINNSSLGRYSNEGLKNSIVEFLLITNAEIVYASAPSTFSHEAVFFNRKKDIDYKLIKNPRAVITLRNQRNNLRMNFINFLNLIYIFFKKMNQGIKNI
jgi:hypothetical protein